VTAPVREVDVAIVGFGPVGAVAANLCGAHGLGALAIDREEDVYDLPRAAVIDDETQRILHAAEVLDAVLPHTAPQVGAEFVDAAGQRIMGVEIPPGLCTPNGYPPLLGIHQPDLERAVRGRLAHHPDVEVWLGHEVDRIEQAPGHVEVTARARDGTRRRVRAQWLLGCDGARSFVRGACGIAWESLGYDHEWLVVDVDLARSDVVLPPFVQQICGPARPVTFVPLPGRLRRWEFQLQPGETSDEMTDPARVRSLLAPWLAPADATIRRAAVYRFHATIAAAFRHGRVFLAGDAAHQMPPFLGQGMCSGIRDVGNLVWKLAAVAHGPWPTGMLDTYEAERRPLALATVAHAADVGRLIDALADQARGGPPPSEALRESGYGGGRALPPLDGGLLVEGGPWAGTSFPQDVIATSAGPRRFDDYVGRRWAVVGTRDPRAAMSEASARIFDVLGTTMLAIPEPSGATGAVLSAHEWAVVRPDRLIYGVTTSDPDLDDLTRRLGGSAQVR
jgi:3-(3-hydroxy-phenyl)propionate hydroxylase